MHGSELRTTDPVSVAEHVSDDAQAQLSPLTEARVRTALVLLGVLTLVLTEGL